MVIHKGEQYPIHCDVKFRNAIVTPENVDGIRIKIGDRLCSWPDGELSFDAEGNVWDYPLTEAQSLILRAGECPAQISILLDNMIYKTDPFTVTVKDGVIRERWL